MIAAIAGEIEAQEQLELDTGCVFGVFSQYLFEVTPYPQPSAELPDRRGS